LAAAKAFIDHLCPILEQKGKSFHFVYCSGQGAETDQNRTLWIMSDTRKVKGAAETGLWRLEPLNVDTFHVDVLRPGGIVPDDSVMLKTVVGMFIPVVTVSTIARALVKVCLDSPGGGTFENKSIVRLGA
jgi:hypothetical protein